MAMVAIRPSAPTAQKVARQPSALPMRRAAGHAENVGNGQAREDQRHGKAALLGRDEPDSHDGGNAEIGAVHHRDQHARRQQQLEAGGQRAAGLADGEGAAQ